MKNKKGFTLVELLCVIIIMVLLIIISYPNFSSLSGKSKTKYDNTTNVLIKNAASMYVNNHLDEFNTSTSKRITIGTLIQDEYLDGEIIGSDGKVKSFSNKEKQDYVEVTRKTNSDGTYEFEYKLPIQVE